MKDRTTAKGTATSANGTAPAKPDDCGGAMTNGFHRTQNGHGKAQRRHANHNDGSHEIRPSTPAEQPLPLLPGEEQEDDVVDVPTRIQVLQDLANICTLAGAIMATLAMACMWKGRQVVTESISFFDVVRQIYIF